MEENYLITIKGTMEQRGDTDTVELMTRGSLVHKDGAYYIVYKETETTGYEGCTTTVKVAEDARKVSMLRFGKQSSQLIIEKGTRHLCHYETGYGSISLGVAADVIEQRLDENGGRLKFSYTLDSGAESFISRNLVDIKNALPRRGRACPALNLPKAPCKGKAAGRALGGAQRAPPVCKQTRSCGCLPRRGKHCSLHAHNPAIPGPYRVIAIENPPQEVHHGL